MPLFKHLALAALLALSGTSATGSLRGLNAANERIDALEGVQMSVDVVAQFLDNLEVNNESIEKMKGIAQALNEMGPKFTEMQDTMFEDSADAEEWSVYSSTLDKFSAVMDTLKDKLDESVSFIDCEGEDISCTMDETSDGPFWCCIGLSGKDCISHIECVAPDLVNHCFIVEPGISVMGNFDTGRVWVNVNEDGIVEEAPQRG